MGYTREQRAANAAKKAVEAAAQAKSTAPAGDLPASPPRKPLADAIAPRGNPNIASRAEIEKMSDERSGMPVAETGGEPAAPAEEAPTAAPAATVEAAPAEEAPAAVEAAAPAEPAPQAAAPAVAMTKQVVDGREYEVSQTDIEEAGGPAAWRKSKAADNRLAEAKEANAESKRLQAAAVQFAQGLVKQNPPQPTQQQVDWQQFLHNRMQYIRGGTEEQATQALQEILTRAMPQPVNAEALQAGAVVNIKRQTAIEKFREEFADVSSNPALMTFASAVENAKLAEMHRTGVIRDYRQAQGFDWNQFYRMIGNEVRGATARQPQPTVAPQAVAAPTPSHPSGPSDKEARKASIVNLPTAAAARAEPPKEDKPETREDILNSMRKKRGLPTV